MKCLFACVFLLLLLLSHTNAACECDLFEPNGSFETATSVTATIAANICPALDVDYYLVADTTGVALSYVSISLTSDTGDVACDQYVQLTASSAQIFFRTFLNGSHTVSAPPGLQFLRCYLRHPASLDSTSSYTLTASISTGLCSSDSNEPDDVKEIATPLTIPLSAPVSGHLCPSPNEDDDWYTFNSSSYQSVALHFKASTAADLYNSAFRGSEMFLIAHNPRGDVHWFYVHDSLSNVTLDLMPGTYYLRFTTWADVAGEYSMSSVYSFNILSVNHPCNASGHSGTSLLSPTAIGTEEVPSTGTFCPVDAEFFLSFALTAAGGGVSLTFVQSGNPFFARATLYKDGVQYNDLTLRSVPGAAIAGYGVDYASLPIGSYVIRLRGDGFWSYDWSAWIYPSSTSTSPSSSSPAPSNNSSASWHDGGPDVLEPNDNMASARPVEKTFTQTDLNLLPSFDRDWFRFDLTEPFNFFVNVTTTYPSGDFTLDHYMSPYHTDPKDYAAIAQFYTSEGTLVASPYSVGDKYTFAERLGPGKVYMVIAPAKRAPFHKVYRYNITVLGTPSFACSGSGTTSSVPTTTVTETSVAAPTTTAAETTTAAATTSPAPTSTNITIPPIFYEIGFRIPSPIRPSDGPIWKSLTLAIVNSALEITFSSYNQYQLNSAPYPRVMFFFDLDNNPSTGYRPSTQEGTIGSELLLQGTNLYRQGRSVFNIHYIGQVSSSVSRPDQSTQVVTLSIPLSTIRSVAPDAYVIRVLGLNDQTFTFAPPGGAFISATLP